jgi:hypothetical protein
MTKADSPCPELGPIKHPSSVGKTGTYYIQQMFQKPRQKLRAVDVPKAVRRQNQKVDVAGGRFAAAVRAHRKAKEAVRVRGGPAVQDI